MAADPLGRVLIARHPVVANYWCTASGRGHPGGGNPYGLASSGGVECPKTVNTVIDLI